MDGVIPMRGPYRPRTPKSTLTLRDLKRAVNDAESLLEEAGILLGRAHVALERDQDELRKRARHLMVGANDRLADAIASLDSRLAGKYASKSGRADAALRAALSQTEPTGDRSVASSSKTEGGRLTAPDVATHGGVA